MKKADLEELPVLDTRRLSPSQVQGLSKLFDEMTEAEFERLPNMAICPARRSLDDGIARISASSGIYWPQNLWLSNRHL